MNLRWKQRKDGAECLMLGDVQVGLIREIVGSKFCKEWEAHCFLPGLNISRTTKPRDFNEAKKWVINSVEAWFVKIGLLNSEQ